jgi:hypothetical protein
LLNMVSNSSSKYRDCPIQYNWTKNKKKNIIPIVANWTNIFELFFFHSSGVAYIKYSGTTFHTYTFIALM